jgi:hypothetical protein
VRTLSSAQGLRILNTFSYEKIFRKNRSGEQEMAKKTLGIWQYI